MKRRFLIGLGLLLLAIILFLFWYLKNTKSHSPADKAVYEHNGLKMEVVYCRPYKKGRVIFGDESEKALQPYGIYWRVGANEATTFEVNKDILVNGQGLKAGKYQLYAVPGHHSWQIYLNSEWDRWGAMEADHETDVVKTEVHANNDAPFTEQLEISFDEPDSVGNTYLNIHWDETLVKVPVSGE